MKLDKVRIVLGDTNEQELAYYATICRRICENQSIQVEIKTYHSSNDLLFDLDDKPFLSLVSILIVRPEDGFEVIPTTARKQGYDGLILYLSSSLSHCLQAFDSGAYNYLIKSGDRKSFARFCLVFQKTLTAASQLHRQYIALSCAGEYRQIDIDDIYYFKGATSRMIQVEYKGGSFQFVSTLRTLEERLHDRGFIRVHRSYLVASRAVSLLLPDVLTLSNGQKIPISRNHAELKRELGRWSVQEGAK
ncbi:MAG: LytTR family transcriptional regulator [Coriobacteriia bacterium]|nr:LytTR family transcriptional regulator [Coriobacteriia bacterium]